MKITKILFLIVFAFAATGCKTDTPSPYGLENPFYPIGTTIKLSDNVVTPTNMPSDSIGMKSHDLSSNGNISYSPDPAIQPNPSPQEPYKPYAWGKYILGSTIARSNNDQYRLIFQSDANLVLFNASSTALWATGAGNYLNTTRLAFQSDGNVVRYLDIFNPLFNVTWSGQVYAGPNPVWILQDDGNLVGYNNHTNNGNGTITITGNPYASTGTAGGKKSKRWGKLK